MNKPNTDWTLETDRGFTDWWANYCTLGKLIGGSKQGGESARQFRIYVELDNVRLFAKTQAETTTALKIIAGRYPAPLRSI